MNLINGRGQLGSALSFRELHIDNLDVYHTWNFLDKTEAVQKNEYEKFMCYLDEISEKIKIVFISTSSKKDDWYTRYKRKSEEQVLLRSKNNLVVRLPCIVGKGVFVGFRDRTIIPYGNVNFLTIEECVNFIISSIDKSGIVQADGWNISAESLCELVSFFQDEGD